jgi:geranylgeranyl pyrophosphate synthase
MTTSLMNQQRLAGRQGVSESAADMTAALRATMRRSLSIAGSDIAEDFTGFYGEPNGKLVRGTLTLRFVRSASGDFQSALAAAAGVEMLHLASMIVDDWMDHAIVRRGRPTVSSRYGALPAVALARHVLYSAVGQFSTYPSQQMLHRVQSTIETMVQGQRREGQVPWPSPWRHYCRCIEGKTAVLFGLAMEVAAIVSQLPPQHYRKARGAGHCIGMAFQIIDDYLDYFGSDGFGKQIGKDFYAGIQTAPLLLYCAKSRRHRKRALSALNAPARSPHDFEQLRAELLSEDIPRATLEVARSYTVRATDQLASLPSIESRDDLVEWVLTLVDRQV